jgi:hypothetical protein
MITVKQIDTMKAEARDILPSYYKNGFVMLTTDLNGEPHRKLGTDSYKWIDGRKSIDKALKEAYAYVEMYKRNINPHIAGFVLKHGDSYTVHMEIGK